MTATDVEPLRDFLAALLGLSDMNAAVAQLAAKGSSPAEIGRQLSEICAPNGQADELAQRLRNPEAARQYVRDIVRTFQPFAAIVRNILPKGRWTKPGRGCKRGNGAKEHRFTPAAEIVAQQAERIAKAEAKRERAEAKRIAERAERAEAKRKRNAERAARFVVTFEDAAAEIGIRRTSVKAYIQKGKLVGIRQDGQSEYAGITRASLDAYKAHLAEIERVHDAIAARKAQAERDTKQRKTVGLYFTEDGRRITKSERMSANEAMALFGYKSKIMLQYMSRAGKIQRVYSSTKRGHAVGYLRSSVIAHIEKRAAEAAVGGVYWTANGRKIVGAQFISRTEAAAALNCHESSVTRIARSGAIVRVYADPGRIAPCGFTRESVAMFAATHPQHIPAKRAAAVPFLRIEELPPKPRALRAARLEPADPDAIEEPQQPDPAKESGPQQPDARPKRKRPCLIFRLTAAQLATATATDTNGENAMSEEANSETTPQQPTAEAKPDKLSVAKAYTVHVGGVIRAICVSEDDRDEIVAALELYQRMKTSPGEIEAALKIYRTVRATMGLAEPPPEPGAADAEAPAA